MTVDAQQIARRFAALAPDRRRAFLEKLAEHGVDFASLPIVPVERGGDLPLSYAQRGLWLTWQRDPASPAYTMAGILSLSGDLDATALQAAAGDLVARHEALRTTFAIDADGRPVQRLHAELPPPFVVRDLRASAQREAESDAFAEAMARQPFDLEAGPLLRFELHVLGEREHRLVLALHHIVADGWSVGLITGDLAALYAARRDGRPSGLPPMTLHYADYAAWQRSWLEAGRRRGSSTPGRRRWATATRRSTCPSTGRGRRNAAMPGRRTASACPGRSARGCAAWPAAAAPRPSWSCWRCSSCCWRATAPATTSASARRWPIAAGPRRIR